MYGFWLILIPFCLIFARLGLCETQYELMNKCLVKEKTRILEREKKLREMVRTRALDEPPEEVGVGDLPVEELPARPIEG